MAVKETNMRRKARHGEFLHTKAHTKTRAQTSRSEQQDIVPLSLDDF